MTQPMDQAMQTMITNLEQNTGRSLGEWVAIATSSGATKHGAMVNHLKTAHGLTHGYANLVAHTALKSDAQSRLDEGDDLVAQMFAGDKAALRPIYDALLAIVDRFGDDVERAPKKGYLSLRRTTQFATLHPSTKSRFDLGLKLKGVEPAGRLEAAGSWNAMVTHRVRLTSPAEVDAEVAAWLRRAYDAA